MKVGLFIPCYIDQAYPHVGMATLDVLEKLGMEIDYPKEQTCCGQPMFNSGCLTETEKVAKKFLNLFKKYDYVVCPSGSCTGMVREHYENFFSADEPDFAHLKAHTFEFCEFLHDVLGKKHIEGVFPHKVGFHQSCHGLRAMGLGVPSEIVKPYESKALNLISALEGIEIVKLARRDECCGFGGTFSVFEEDISAFMGEDRVLDHEASGAEIIASYDISCLMHLEGIIKRHKKKLKIMHISEILSEGAKV